MDNSKFIGFAASVSFLCFSFLYLVIGQLQWPLLGASFFLCFLQNKYDKNRLGTSFYLLDKNKSVDLNERLVALPTRVGDTVAFVQEKQTLSLYDISNNSFTHKKLDDKLMPMSAFHSKDKWLVWAKNKVIIFDEELNELANLPLNKCGVSLVFERVGSLYFATTNEVLFSYNEGSFTQVNLDGIAYKYDDINDYFLTSQGIIYKYTEEGFEKKNTYLKEVLSASSAQNDLFMYKSNQQILKQNQEGISNLSNYHKEFGFPEVVDDVLYFVNLNRELVQLDSESNITVIKKYDKSPFIHRKIGDFLLLLFEVGKSTQIELFSYKSQKTFSFSKEGYFCPLGLSALSFDFSYDMTKYYSWTLGQESPNEYDRTLSQVLHFDQKKYYLEKSIWYNQEGQKLQGLKTQDLEINFDFQKVGMIPIY
ncbi:MAG: hypothetical protein KC646_17545 [Candidatus Cloacimonetes bacterium]|nr:hypothetical protein [Candidatus Cloacimonadota bacterium]